MDKRLWIKKNNPKLKQKKWNKKKKKTKKVK